MKYCLYLLFFCVASCQMDTSESSVSSKDVFKLAINPPPSSQYFYDIENETNLKTEVDGKEVHNKSKSSIGLFYTMHKDSLGNHVIDITYDKVLLHTKNGEQETELNADNATTSINPVEKMLGYLKGTRLTAILDSKGKTKEIRGYKELGEKILAGFAENDAYGKAMAQKQWEGMMRQQLVDNNLQQLFKIFPDSSVHVGEKWNITTTDKTHFNLNTYNTYMLKKIKNNIATIDITGKIKTEKGIANLTGYEIAADLNGEQQGIYEVDLKTGMLINSVMEAETEGKMQAAGREIPIKLYNKISVKQRK